MALDDWLGGAIFNLTGSDSSAFITGVCVNLMNLTLIGRGRRPSQVGPWYAPPHVPRSYHD